MDTINFWCILLVIVGQLYGILLDIPAEKCTNEKNKKKYLVKGFT